MFKITELEYFGYYFMWNILVNATYFGYYCMFVQFYFILSDKYTYTVWLMKFKVISRTFQEPNGEIQCRELHCAGTHDF